MANANATATAWDKKTEPKDGQTMNLSLTFKKTEVIGKDDKGQDYTSIFLANIGKGSGRFRHGETIATLPNGDKVTLDVRVKLLKAKDSESVTIASSQFQIN